MQDIDLSKIKKVFFIGIGGIGISAIARMMFLEGKKVSGSDMSENELTHELKELGIKITIGQGFELIPTDTELIIYTIAIPHYDQKLFDQVVNSGISYRSYPQMLGIVTAGKNTIAVAGTHGKTTTTAMIAKILIDAGRDPSVIVGSLLKDFKSNLIVGKGDLFVVEACEYERSFLNLKPKILVILNIEPDHLDYYKDLADIKNAFDQLASQSEKVISDYAKYLEKVPKLLVPGLHNRMDAAAAMAVADMLGISEEISQKSLSEFSGTWRRLEKRGQTEKGTIVYDDYAHHPTEIQASLQGLRELYPKGGKKITVLFQPHLYSRTKALFEDFVKSFKEADRILLLPIYFAREDKDPTISSEKLAEAIVARGEDAEAFADFESAERAVLALKLGAEDIFITMGAGEAYKVADKVFSFG
jgi:UDP-N-acetylmuramate--alanine ligase